MYLLLPPSEGKRSLAEGPPLALSELAFPELGSLRSGLVDALARWCARDPEGARIALGIGPSRAAEVLRNAVLADAPCAPAWWTYSGVLYAALDAQSLDIETRNRLARRTVVASALFGLIGLSDRIPAYRFSGGGVVPGLGGCPAYWRGSVSRILGGLPGLIVDLRSGDYIQCGPIPAAIAHRTVVPRVLQVVPKGPPKVVTHFNKATKGRLARLISQWNEDASTPEEFAEGVAASGLAATLFEPAGSGKPWTMDILVEQV